MRSDDDRASFDVDPGAEALARTKCLPASVYTLLLQIDCVCDARVGLETDGVAVWRSVDHQFPETAGVVLHNLQSG